mgnify:FL=1
MCLAKSILLGQVGATCCAATFFIKSMTTTLAILLGKASTPKMVALGATAMSATQPIPIFCGSVVTSIKGAAIHDEGGLMPWIMCLLSVCLDRQASSPKQSTCAQVPARHVIKYGARENMTKQEKLTNGANRIVTLVYVE